MWVNVRLKLEPGPQQSRELVELLKQVAATELQRRKCWSPNPVDWFIALIEPPIDRFSGALLDKVEKWATRAGLVRRKHKGKLP